MMRTTRLLLLLCGLATPLVVAPVDAQQLTSRSTKADTVRALCNGRRGLVVHAPQIVVPWLSVQARAFDCSQLREVGNLSTTRWAVRTVPAGRARVTNTGLLVTTYGPPFETDLVVCAPAEQDAAGRLYCPLPAVPLPVGDTTRALIRSPFGR